MPEDTAIASRIPAPGKNQNLSMLEARVTVLEKALTEMAARLGEELDLVQIAEDLNQEDGEPIEDAHE